MKWLFKFFAAWHRQAFVPDGTPAKVQSPYIHNNQMYLFISRTCHRRLESVPLPGLEVAAAACLCGSWTNSAGTHFTRLFNQVEYPEFFVVKAVLALP